MGAWSRFKTWLFEVPPEETRESEFNEDAVSNGLREWLNPTKLTRDNAFEIPAFSAAVDFMAGVVSQLPIKLYKRTGEDVTELEDDRRVRLLNGDTGDLIRGPEMMNLFVQDYYTNKGGFIYVNRVGNQVESLHYIDPDVLQPVFDEMDHIFKRAAFLVDGLAFYPWQFIYACRNARYGVYGQSICEQSNDALNAAWKTIQLEKGIMDRGGNRKGILSTEGKISQDTLDKLAENAEHLFSNSKKSIVALNQGVHFDEITESSVELQLAENKKANADDIYSLFLIAAPLIRGGADEEDHKNFVNYALNPLLSILQSAINSAMLLETEKDQNYYFEFDLKEFTKASMKERWEAWSVAKKNGMVNADEFRRFENLPPLGMDYINLGLNDVLMDPVTHEIIVPNMGAIIDPNAQPIDAKSNANSLVSNSPSEPPKGGEDSGDQSEQ